MHLTAVFKFLYGLPRFFLRGKFIPKLLFLAAVRPHFKRHNGESWRGCGDLGDTPRAKFCKNCL